MDLIIKKGRIKQILKEELSISDDVKDISKMCLDFIMEDSSKNKFDRKDTLEYKNGGHTLVPSMQGSTILEHKNFVFFLSYTVDNFESFDEAFMFIKSNGSYDFETNTLHINCIAVNGEINYKLIQPTIMHEVEHLLQSMMSKRPLYGHLYKMAKSHLNDGNPMIKHLASFIYYSNYAEIDARINGFYKELFLLHDYYGDGAMNHIDETIFHEVEDFMENFIPTVSDEMLPALHYFGFSSAKSFKNMGKRALEYLKRKKMKVIQKYIKDVQVSKRPIISEEAYDPFFNDLTKIPIYMR